MFDNDQSTPRAVAVEYARNGELHHAEARREVILCGGVINSPQLLMLSGIGPAGHVQAHGIESFRPAGCGQQPARPYCLRSPLAAAHSRSLTPNDARRPNCPRCPAYTAWRQWLLQSHTRGGGPQPRRPRASRRTTDPSAIFLNHKEQATASHRGMFRRMREIGAQPGLEAFIAEELAPGLRVQSDAEVDAFIRSQAITLHHPVGTCRMGPDESASGARQSDACARREGVASR